MAKLRFQAVKEFRNESEEKERLDCEHWRDS
jgi:hypothetical protein